MRTPDPKSRPRNLSLRRREIRDIFLQLGRIQYRKSIKTTLLPVLLIVLVLGVTKMQGQEVFIPDPGLNSAVRDAVEKPTGPLTVQDMLGMVKLNANQRGVRSLEGLEAASNLVWLSLSENSLAHFITPNTLTNLNYLDLSHNLFENFPEIGNLMSLEALYLVANQLTNGALPLGLTRLGTLDLNNNQLRSFILPTDTTNLQSINLDINYLTNCTLPVGLNKLQELNISFNYDLTSLRLPSGLTNLQIVHLNSDYHLTDRKSVV